MFRTVIFMQLVPGISVKVAALVMSAAASLSLTACGGCDDGAKVAGRAVSVAGATSSPSSDLLFIKRKLDKNDFSNALINGLKKMTTYRMDRSMNIAMPRGEAMAALNQSVKATYWLDDSKRVVGTTAEVSKLRSTGSSGPAIGNGSDTYATQGSTEGCEKSRRGSASLTTASSLMGLAKIVEPLAHEDRPGPISSSRSSRRGVPAACRARAMRRRGNTGASLLRIGQFSRRGDGRGAREPGPMYVVGIFVTAPSGLLEVTPLWS